MFPKVYFQRGERGALLEKFRASSGVQKKIIPTRKLNGVDLLRLQDIQKRIYEARLCLGLEKSPKDRNEYGPKIPFDASPRTYLRSNSAWRRLSAFGSRVDCMRSRRAVTSISCQKNRPPAPGINLQKEKEEEKRKEKHPVEPW